MPRLTFENKITLGNAIQIALIIFAVITAYFGIVSRVDGSARDITALQGVVSGVPSIQDRLTRVEVNQVNGKNDRIDFQNKTEATLDRLTAQNSLIMAQLAGIIARMDEAGKTRK